jgi:hypothetical protein
LPSNAMKEKLGGKKMKNTFEQKAQQGCLSHD